MCPNTVISNVSFNEGRDCIIPFGAHYYKYPMPSQMDWERDLSNFSRHGFNTIGISAQWRVNNPQEDAYDFDDIDRIMELAAEYGLKAVIDIILDASPVWFSGKHPEADMVTSDGRILMPAAAVDRQTGGAPGPCLHHKQGRIYRQKFIEELAKRYRKNETLLLWDICSRPDIGSQTCSSIIGGNRVCYCDATRTEFIDWLRDKYGTIAGLNGKWQRCYRDFKEAEMPRSYEGINDMIDFGMFLAESMSEELEMRANAIRKHDGMHPVMAYPVDFRGDIDRIASGHIKAAAYSDIIGSRGGTPFNTAVSSRAADGKPVLAIGIHTFESDSGSYPPPITFDSIKKKVFGPYAKGAGGFIFRHYRPELLARRNLTAGLAGLSGEQTAAVKYASAVNEILRQNAPLLLKCRPLERKVAIIRDCSSEIFDLCTGAPALRYLSAVEGVYSVFRNLNIGADIVDSGQIKENADDLSQYGLIYCPLPYYMDGGLAGRLADWVKSGGVLISEASFGAYKAEDNLHSTVIPGYGFDEVFGLKEWTVDNGCDRLGYRIEYTASDGSRIDACDLTVKETVIPSTAVIIGTFDGGEPAMAVNEYGSGKAFFIGTLFGDAYNVAQDKGISDIVSDIAGIAGIHPYASAGRRGIILDLLADESDSILIISNESSYSGDIGIRLRTDSDINGFECLEGGTAITRFSREDTDGAIYIRFTTDIGPYGIRILRGI